MVAVWKGGDLSTFGVFFLYLFLPKYKGRNSMKGEQDALFKKSG